MGPYACCHPWEVLVRGCWNWHPLALPRESEAGELLVLKVQASVQQREGGGRPCQVSAHDFE